MKWGPTLAAAQDFIGGKLPEQPAFGLLLGSGLAETIQLLSQPITIDYSTIPGYPHTSVAGHPGQYVFGYVEGTPVLAARGRLHYYEGHSIPATQLPVRLLARLGATVIIITNAAGCTNERWSIGDFMVHTGHLDCSFLESASLPQVASGLPWHTEHLIQTALAAAALCDVKMRQGNYAWTLGPTFETPAEIGMIRKLGGDVVGMSTVPEYWAAAEEQLEVLGISCLTNYAAGVNNSLLNHAAVLEAGVDTSAALATLIEKIIGLITDG